MKWKTILITTLLLAIAGCDKEPDKEQRAEMSGKELFTAYCAACHGSEGQGKFLKGIPPNKFTEKSMTEIIQQIRQGSKHSDSSNPMPPMPFISQAEARRIAHYMVSELKESP